MEGILEQVYEELSEKVFVGDSSSADSDDRKNFETFLKKLKEVSALHAMPLPMYGTLT